jgi:serine/threonine-protein kinase
VPATVPSVVGQPRAAAEAAIIAAGFAVGTVSEQNDLIVPQGAIVSQTPAGSSIALRGSAIDLVVSQGTFIAGVPQNSTCSSVRSSSRRATP